MRTFTLNCSLDFAAITSDSNQRLSVLFIPGTLPLVLVYAGQELRGFIIRDCKRGGRVSGRCVCTIWRHPCFGSRVLKFVVGFNN